MEFPHLGQHCSELSCNRLDFLPVKCDSCDKLFCGDHMLYANHRCEAAYKKDIQVPVCPLCNQPVPIKRGDLPDVSVGEHIDRDCQSDPAKQKRIYVNKCSAKHCKTKEIVKVMCRSCNRNYCLKHRHPQDHDCQKVKVNELREIAMNNPRGPYTSNLTKATSSSNSTKATSASNSTKTTYASNSQSFMNEDEALARAIHLSLNDNQASPVRLRSDDDEDLNEDLSLAKAIAESEKEYRRQQEMHTKKETCVVV